MPNKLRPTACVDVIVRNNNGEVIASPRTYNSLKMNVIQDFGRGLFSQRFSIRLGTSSMPTDYADVYLTEEKKLTGNVPWPIAEANPVWPVAEVIDDQISWSTTQTFIIANGDFIGNLRELGFNFYGDQSDVIHARAVLPTDINIDESYSLEIIYKLSLVANFSETTYITNCVSDRQTTTHTVTQRWARRTTLWNILGAIPKTNNCAVFSGQLNGYDVDPDGYLSESTTTSVELYSDTAISLEARFGSDDGNSWEGIQSVVWDTIPIKMSFNPPLPKTVETDLVFKIVWELSQ